MIGDVSNLIFEKYPDVCCQLTRNTNRDHIFIYIRCSINIKTCSEFI